MISADFILRRWRNFQNHSQESKTIFLMEHANPPPGLRSFLFSEVWIKISQCITWCLKFIGGMDFVCEVKGLWLGIHGKVPTEPAQSDLKWPESLGSATNFIFRSLVCVLLFKKKYDGVGNPSIQNNLFLYIRSYYRLRTSIFGTLQWCRSALDWLVIFKWCLFCCKFRDQSLYCHQQKVGNKVSKQCI